MPFILHLSERVFDGVNGIVVGEIQLAGLLEILGAVEDVFFFTAGLPNTMARSSSESALNGTSVRTPIARQTSVISDHISVFHGATAPLIDRERFVGHEGGAGLRCGRCRSCRRWSRRPDC